MSLLRSAIFLLAASAFALMNCSCGPQPMAGGTSETTNGFSAVVRSSNGAPVSHALVRLRPEGYLSDTANAAISYDSASVIDTFTDANGRFRITAIDTGKYTIEIRDMRGEEKLLKSTAHKDSIIDCGIAVVEPAGNIRGFINRKSLADGVAVYVRVYGMERMVRADPASGSFVLQDMPLGNHEIYFIASSPSYEPREVTASVSSAGGSDVGTVSLFPYHGWAYSRVLGFNTTASGADIIENVYAFPVLVRLHSGNFSFSQAKPNGEDIRFAKSDSTPLPFEIERWDPVTGRAEVWIKIDTVFGKSSGQTITMYWGASTMDVSGSLPDSAASLSNGAAVFDTAGGFQGVWHLGDAAGDSVRDATINRYDGVSPDTASPSIVDGLIGNCRVFDGTADFITMPNTADSKLSFPQEGNYTVYAWVFLDTFDNAPHCIVSKGYEQYFLRFTYFPSNTPSWEFVEFDETANWQSSRSPATNRQWILLAGVRQGSSQFLYCNGVLVDSTKDAWPQGISRKTSNDLSIGSFLKKVTVPANDGYCFFKGSIDEVRVISTAQGPDWVRLCYMNQRSDDKLIIFK